MNISCIYTLKAVAWAFPHIFKPHIDCIKEQKEIGELSVHLTTVSDELLVSKHLTKIRKSLKNHSQNIH